MSSNALGFTREVARDLRDRGLRRCVFSLDSPRAERHDANRGTPGCFDQVLRAIEHCVAVGIDANLSTCAMAELVLGPELEELIALTRRSGAGKLRLVLPKMAGRLAGNEAVLLRPDQLRRIARLVAHDPVAYVEAEGNTGGRIEKCFCLRGHVYVNPYGVVQPCVYTLLNFGNVRHQPLKFLYARMFHHRVFRDKSVLNLCLLQNPSFVREHLAGVSDDRPLVPVDFDETPGDPVVHEPVT